MDYMGDEKYWNSRFEERENTLAGPEEDLVENIQFFKKGSTLDIACGDGRNTLFLLQNNFKVTSIDFSTKALERLEKFVTEKSYEVKTGQVDLSAPNALKGIGVFDNIVVNHYRLSRENLDTIKDHISDQGVLFVSGHGHKNKPNERFRAEDFIQDTDFYGLKDSFELIKYKEEENQRGFLVTYIFQKK